MPELVHLPSTVSLQGVPIHLICFSFVNFRPLPAILVLVEPSTLRAGCEVPSELGVDPLAALEAATGAAVELEPAMLAGNPGYLSV